MNPKEVTQMSRVTDEWVKRFAVEGAGSSNTTSNNGSASIVSNACQLQMGWAIPKRSNRTLSNTQKKFLNKLFDDGEKLGVKVTAEHAFKLMRKEFDRVNFLPLNSIKSYFSRRKKAILDGEKQVREVLPVGQIAGSKTNVSTKDKDAAEQEEEEGDESDDEDGDELERELNHAVSKILLLVEKAPDLQPDDWIAVDMGSTWYPGQFIQFDAMSEELEVTFMHRSPSNERWFVWPSLEHGGEEDKGWVEERYVFYRLSGPKEGRRQTLLFDEYDQVDIAFRDL